MTVTARRTSSKSTPHQRAWYWYDFANSAFYTTTLGVFFAPYLTSLAKAAACPNLADGEVCRNNLYLFGIPISPGSLSSYTTTAMTLISAILLLFVGAIADKSPRPQILMGGFAWVGSLAAASMFFMAGTDWQLGTALMMVAGFCGGASIVIYDSILIRIATPDERDKVSSRGWALGYAAGFILLALNFGVMTFHDQIGLDTGTAVRINLASAGIWWAAFTFIPVLGLKNLPPSDLMLNPAAGQIGPVRQLGKTLSDLRNYPQTLLFLVAYMFFNDGVQTVIYSASLYGSEELRQPQSNVLVAYLVVQLVAIFGALGFGRLAASFGAKVAVLTSLGIWLVVVAAAFYVPADSFLLFLALGVSIGIVLGGTQALARSLYSQLIPKGREAEFFAFYQAMERGTSWFGTLTFGLVYQFTNSYRWAIVALVFFFLVGGALLAKVDMRKGIRDAGNEAPAVV